MKVRFSPNTDDDFRKHKDYLRRKGKSDGHGFQEYELKGISKALKKNITKELEDKKEHKDSIFPKENGFEYNVEDYKMFEVIYIKFSNNSQALSYFLPLLDVVFCN